MLWLAAFLVSESARSEWVEEWFAELWHRWLANQVAEKDLYARVRELYVVCAGCFPDGWWHFCQSGEARLRVVEWMRSPRLCLGFLCVLLLGLVAATDFLATTRDIVSPLPYDGSDLVAIISRTGRMEPIRKGVPEELAKQWRRKSVLINRLAMCSFPKPMMLATLIGKREAVGIGVTENFFSTLGVALPAAGIATREKRSGVWLSDLFWRKQLHSAARLQGERIEVNGKELVVEGILPVGFWFLSPSVSLYEVDSDAVPAQSLLVVRCKQPETAKALENELSRVAERGGYEFAQTAPHAMFLRDAVTTPLWLFGSALVVAITLVTMAHGSRWLNHKETSRPSHGSNWRGWAFFLLKTGLGLLFVFLAGVEVFVGRNQQAISEALGGPALIWFYIVGCTLVLFASVSDQQSRCRVCQRLLGFPIRIGCPGCLFLDWAGTEFLCPQGHGVLYVPHHVSCWEEADRWILLEA
jgi:hypothetical protein